MPQINSVHGLSDIKTISKCEANQTSGFQDIAFTSNCGWTNRHKDIRTDSAILYKYGTSFDWRIKTYQHISHFRHNASAIWFVCLGFTLLFWVYITMVLACSSGTLTNVLPHWNAILTPHPITVHIYNHRANLTLCYIFIMNVLGLTRTFNKTSQCSHSTKYEFLVIRSFGVGRSPKKPCY